MDALIEELRERIGEELDYVHEAENQRMFAAYFDGHPTISVPKIVDDLSTARVVTSELATGARFAELLTWPQADKDLAAETIYRFTFRSLYEAHAFNGDPHPGNYLFHRGGRVTFLDFGLVKHFTPEELQPLVHMVRYLCVDEDPEAFRRAMEDADFLTPGAPIPTEQVVEHMALFYDTVRTRGPRTMTPGYASAGRPQVLRLPQPAGRLRPHPPLLRDPAADQPGHVRRCSASWARPGTGGRSRKRSGRSCRHRRRPRWARRKLPGAAAAPETEERDCPERSRPTPFRIT